MAGFYSTFRLMSGVELGGAFASLGRLERCGVRLRGAGKKAWLAPEWLDVDLFADFDGSPEELGILIGDYDERVWRDTCSLELSPVEVWARWPPSVCAGLGVDFDILPMEGGPTTYGRLSWSIWREGAACLGHQVTIEYPLSIEDRDGSFKAWTDRLLEVLGRMLEPLPAGARGG